MFQNSRTGVTKWDWPDSEAGARSLRQVQLWGIGSPQSSILKTSKVLSSVESVRALPISLISPDVISNTKILSSRLGILDVAVAHEEGIWADLVSTIEAERILQQQTNSTQIDFLYQRLREAQATIDKLLAGTSHQKRGDLRMSLQIVENDNSWSFMVAPPESSSTTSPSTTEESAILGGALRKGTAPNLPAPPKEGIEDDPVSIQSNSTQGGTADEEQSNTTLNIETSSTRKRKRATQKDPGKFKHECEACGERFTRSTTLREHARSHNNERPHPCSKCPKAFARKKDRIRHEKLHAEGKKYKCDFLGYKADGQCGREFAREDGLTAHWRTERGGKCLQVLAGSPIIGDVAYHVTEYDAGFCCIFTPSACRSKFAQFEDLQKHIMDPASRNCVAEWLIQEFLEFQREERFTLLTDESEGEKESTQSQRITASSPSQDSPRHIQTTNKDSSPHIEERAEPSRAITPLGSGSMDDEQGMTAPVSQDELRSLQESVSDFDPFDAWRLVEAHCLLNEFSSGQIYIDLNCTTMPTCEYQIIVETLEMRPQKTEWWSNFSGGYRGRLVLELWYRLINGLALSLPGKEVYVAYTPNQGPEKTFTIGTLDFDPTNRRWKIIRTPESKSSSIPCPIPEIVEERPAIENASMLISGDRHSIDYINKYADERHVAIEEVIIDRGHSTDAPISEEESHLSSPDFSKWVFLSSGFSNSLGRICAEVNCPASEVHSQSLYFRVGRFFRRIESEPYGDPSNGHFLIYIADFDLSSFDRKHDQLVDLVFVRSSVIIDVISHLGSLRCMGFKKEWDWVKG